MNYFISNINFMTLPRFPFSLTYELSLKELYFLSDTGALNSD